MAQEAEEELYLHRNLTCMYLLGQYKPKPQWPFIVRMFYYTWRVFVFYVLFSSIIFGVIDIFTRDKIDDITDITLNIINIFLFGSPGCRGLYFTYHSDKVEKIINKINAIMLRKTRFAAKDVTMKRGEKIAKYMYNFWLWFALSVGWGMVGTLLFSDERILPTPAWTPYDQFATPYFELTFIYQTFAQHVLVITFVNIEMINVCSAILLTEQFHLLSIDFSSCISNALIQSGLTLEEVEEFESNMKFNECTVEALYKKVINTTKTSKFKGTVLSNFNACTEQHRNILDFINTLQDLYGPILLVTIFFNFCYLIYSLFSIVMTNNAAMYLPLAQYVAGSIMQMFMVMFFSQRLTNHVELLRQKVHNIPWYICDRAFIQNYHFVLMNVGKDIYLAAGKLIPMSMEVFLNYLKKAFSFYAVLRQVVVEE